MPYFPTAVVVGIDGSAPSRHAVRVAAELCRATSSPLHLLHVKLPQPLLRGQPPLTPAQRERTDRESRQLLDAEAAVAAELGVEVAGTHLRYAQRPVDAFARVQQELSAGLLVVGERPGTSTLGRQLMSGASVTGAVRRSPASVLVVRAPH